MSASFTNEFPQRILMTADAVGGVWDYSLNLSRQLQDHNVEVLLAVMGPTPTVAQRKEAAASANVMLQCIEFPLEWYEYVTQAELNEAGRWLMSVANDFNPDIVHLNGYAHAALNWPCPVLVAAHSCVYSWWNAVHGTEPPDSWQKYKQRVVQGLDAASAVVAPSSAMLSDLKRAYGIEIARAATIYNFDVDDYPQLVEKQPFALACGRAWDKSKNYQTLDCAAANMPWPVQLVGDASHPAGQGTSFKHLRTTGRMPKSDLKKLMSEASIFIHPAKYEPFGLVVLEAARHGCALILADIPSFRELWDGCALFVPPDDAKAWNTAMRALIADKPQRERLAQRASAHTKRYSPEQSTQRYLSLYQHLMSLRDRAATENIHEFTNQTLLPLHCF